VTPSPLFLDPNICPACEHCHPNGVGGDWCGCGDCFLLSGRIERQWMGEEAGKRYDELRALQTAAAEARAHFGVGLAGGMD
jgi:hypothetical protein